MRMLPASVVISLVSFFGVLVADAAGDEGQTRDHTGAVTRDAAGIINSRQEMMSYVGSNMRTVSRMAKGNIEFNRDYVRAFGLSVSAIAVALPHLFPEGTGKEAGTTEADAAIFSDLGGFAAEATKLGAAGRAVAMSADAAELSDNFSAMAGTCTSCHSQYRSR